MENKKIKMLVVPSDYSGVCLYRSKGPHVYIQEHYPDEFDIDIIYMKDFPANDLANFFSQYDLIHVHKQLDGGMKVMDTINFMDIPVIIDVDDNFRLGPDHPMYLTSKRDGWAEKITNHIKRATYVTTTTPIFAKELLKFNKNVAVLPNAIDKDDPQFQQEKKKSDRIRFGIVCGSTHRKDIELIQGISSLPKEIKDKMQIVLCGFDTNGTTTIYDKKTGQATKRQIQPHESVWCRYEEYLTSNYKEVTPEHAEYLKKYIKADDPFENDFYRRFWTRDIQHYATHYENVDVLLAPLKENDFNKTKSQLKLIEAGFTDTAVIAQNFGPYTLDSVPYIEKGGIINENGNCLLVDTPKNHKQWAKYIKYVVEHPECIKIMGENLKKDMQERYSMENVARERVELYRKIVEEYLIVK